jgi:uncharacterized damage-inducible protein DinB
MNHLRIFLESVISRFASYKQLGDKTFEQLDEKEFQVQPNEASNSIAVIIQHMSGNMISRWTNFLTEDGEKPWRKRDEEFEEKSATKAELMELWNRGWVTLLHTLEDLTDQDMDQTISIRGEKLSVIDAINRQLAHYSYHVGQIVYLGKWLRNEKWKTLSIEKGKSEEFYQKMSSSQSKP